MVVTSIAYLKELFKKWWVFLLFFLLFGGLALWYLSIRVTTYSGKLTLMTNEEKSSNYSPLLQIMGQFGMSGNAEAVNAEKIIELLYSRLIIVKTLNKLGTIEDKDDLLMNHYAQAFNINKWYHEKPELKNVTFTPKDYSAYNWSENRISQDIYQEIVDHHLKAGTSENGIIEINFTSMSEEFSKAFLDNLFETLSEFYITKTNQRQRETFDIVQHYYDSLQVELRQAEFELASLKDKNILKTKSKGMLEELRAFRKVETLNVAYTEALKNLEMSKFNLINQTPILQLIDQPVYPLKENKPKIMLISFVVLLFTFFFASLFIISNKIIKDALKA